MRPAFAFLLTLGFFASSALAGGHGHKFGTGHPGGSEGIRNFDSDRLVDGIGRDQRNDFFVSNHPPTRPGGFFGHRSGSNVQTATGGPFENVYRDFISASLVRRKDKVQTGTGGPLRNATVVTTTGGPFLNVTAPSSSARPAKH